MRHQYRGLILTAGVLATVAAGGGLTAWASWSTKGSAATTAHSGRVPAMEPPQAEISGKTPKIDWTAVRLSATVPVDRYVLIRIDGSARTEVCRTAALSCRDADAPAGSTLTYVVHATKGGRWVGSNSEPSNAVVTPGPKKSSAQAKVLSEVAAAQETVSEPNTGTTPAPGENTNRSTDPAGEGASGSETVQAEESTPAKSAAPTVSPPAAGSEGVPPVPETDPTSSEADKQ